MLRMMKSGRVILDMYLFLSDSIQYRYGDPGWCEEAVAPVALQLFAAVATFVFVVQGMYVSQSDGGFQAPAFIQYPLITVAQSAAQRPALVAVVLV